VQTTSRSVDVPGARVARPRGAGATLTGSPAARRLYQQVADNPDMPLRLEVVGSGGHGKTVLLDALAEAYTRAGTAVVRRLPDSTDEDPPPARALLVDDAHELPDAEVERILRWSLGPDARVVLAHRPWPRPAALSALAVAFGAGRAPLVLGPLDRAGVAERAAMLLGERPSVELVELVSEQTGGSPMLVDRLLLALRDRGGLTEAGAAAGEPPAAVLHQLDHQLHLLPGPVRELLLGQAVGGVLDPDVLAALLAVATEAVVALVEEAAASGLLLPDGELVPLARQALLRLTPVAHQLAVRRRLAGLRLDHGASVLTVARGLLGTGATGTRVAAVLADAGNEALAEYLPIAVDLYAAAVEAGAPRVPLAARRAEAAMLVGDLDAALTHTDLVLTSDTADAEPVRAAIVAAAVLAHRGLLTRSAEIYRWLGAERLGQAAVLAVPALIGTGALTEAREALGMDTSATARPGRPPTLLAGAEELIARGMYDTVAGSPVAALSQLTRAATLLEVSGRAALLTDTPAALAALVAVHSGELEVAQAVLDAAVAGGSGGRAYAARHCLLQAWIAMHRGGIVAARNLLAAAEAGGRLGPRDELLAAALDVALARRTSDVAALMLSWGRARRAIVRHPVDLYSLQPLGELAIGAARLREQSWVAPYLDAAQALLGQLGNPPLWAAPLHWSGLHSAIAADDGDTATRHTGLLEKIAGTGRYAAALAGGGRAWLRALTGDVDAAAVEDAARGLYAVGLAWEGGRLAGQAALRTRDRKEMTVLLGIARSMQGMPAPAVARVPTPGPPPEPGSAAPPQPRVPPVPAEEVEGRLSDREREVAELVLAGLTYKQIGEQLFISAKTVEHHVSRMRRRLRSGSRGELFTHLRMLVDGASTD